MTTRNRKPEAPEGTPRGFPWPRANRTLYDIGDPWEATPAPIRRELVRIFSLHAGSILEANPPNLPGENLALADRFKKYGSPALFQPAFWTRFEAVHDVASLSFRKWLDRIDAAFSHDIAPLFPSPKTGTTPPRDRSPAEGRYRREIAAAKKELADLFRVLASNPDTRGRPKGATDSTPRPRKKATPEFKASVHRTADRIEEREGIAWGATAEALRKRARRERLKPASLKRRLARVSRKTKTS